MRAAAAVLLAVLISSVRARENATGAFNTFKITECEVCTDDGDSIFCSDGEGFIYNATMPKMYPKLDARDSPIPGPFCWEGTFGAMLNKKGNFTNGILGSRDWIYADLTCDGMKLYYRQCIIPADLATVLFVIGSIIFVTCCAVFCICFGLCKCGHETNELQCCWLMTCKRVQCCAPKTEVTSRIEDRSVAATLTGKADDALDEEKKEKKLSAKEKLALRKKEMQRKREAESAMSGTANPLKEAEDKAALMSASAAE